MKANLPEGLILIVHNGFARIPITECINGLPEDWRKLPREVVEINYSEKMDLAKLYNLNYGQFALEHRRQFNNEISTLLTEKNTYTIVYFGLAPMPLAIDFGQLFHNFRSIEVFQKHHVTKEWYQEVGETENNPVHIKGIPDKDQKGITEALIRVSISHSINPDDTYELLPNAAEIDIELKDANEDAITTRSKMIEVAEAYKSVLDDLSENRSSLTKVHLFTSIPCGVAFFIGTKISPNIHPYVQTYQYSKTKEPKYIKAILVKGEVNVGRKITEESKTTAAKFRALSNKELTENIKRYCELNKEMSAKRNWYQGIFPMIDAGIMNEKFWTDLPAMCDTSLQSDSFDFEAEIIDNGFYWRNNKWYVDDNFFISISKRLPSDDEIRKAVRLFLFHESLHYKRHKLTELTSVNIGSFPKVLEIADYQADVYGILNEYGYQIKTIGEVADVKQFFLETIRVATETMWSFDDNGVSLGEIQIRRLNRYMNWYWQFARIEKDGNSLNEIIKILEEKPVIELNGLKTKEENNRFFFVLEKRHNQPLELGVFHNNNITRDGSASNMPIENLVKGFSELNGKMILDVLRSFVNR